MLAAQSYLPSANREFLFALATIAIACSVQPVHADHNPDQPITDLKIVAGGKDVKPPKGYDRLRWDLNRGAGGPYIYLCVKRGDGKPLTGLKVIESKSEIPETPSGWTRVNVNCNQGTEGHKVYVYYSRDGKYAVTDIRVVAGQGRQELKPYKTSSVDLNRGCGDDTPYLYLAYRLSGNKNRFPVEAVANDESGDTEASAFGRLSRNGLLEVEVSVRKEGRSGIGYARATAFVLDNEGNVLFKRYVQKHKGASLPDGVAEGDESQDFNVPEKVMKEAQYLVVAASATDEGGWPESIPDVTRKIKEIGDLLRELNYAVDEAMKLAGKAYGVSAI